MWVVWNCSQGCNKGGPEFQHLPFLQEVRRQAHPWIDAGHLCARVQPWRLFTWPCWIFSFIFSSSENPGRVDWESYLISLNKDSEAQRGKGMSPLLTRRNGESVSFFLKALQGRIATICPWFIFWESNLSGKSCWAINDLYMWKRHYLLLSLIQQFWPHLALIIYMFMYKWCLFRCILLLFSRSVVSNSL